MRPNFERLSELELRRDVLGLDLSAGEQAELEHLQEQREAWRAEQSRRLRMSAAGEIDC